MIFPIDDHSRKDDGIGWDFVAGTAKEQRSGAAGGGRYGHFHFFPQKIIILGFMMSFGERNWHGIFAGQGYVRVWAGRPGSDNPPKESSDWLPQKNFCTTHFRFENRSFVEFTEKNEHHGGDVGENGCFP